MLTVWYVFSTFQVDRKDLRDASHEDAVNAFRASGDPVEMVILRRTRKTRSSDAATQTQNQDFVVAGGVVGIAQPEIFLGTEEEGGEKKTQQQNAKRRGWFNPMVMSISTDISSGEQKSDYDSAYDTLNKSSRHSQQTSPPASHVGGVGDGQSDLESTTNTERTVTAGDNDSVFKENVSTSDASEEKEQCATFIVPDLNKEHFLGMDGNMTDAEAGLEFEYEVCITFLFLFFVVVFVTWKCLIYL